MTKRLFFGAICMICAAWVASSYSGKIFPYDAIVALLGAIAAWVWAENEVSHTPKSDVPTLHPADRELGNKLRSLFDAKTRRFIREHDFGQPFNVRSLANIEIVADDWRGAEFEFENSELDNLTAEIVRISRNFMERLAIYSGSADNWPEGTLSVPNQSERGDDWFSDQTRAYIKELHDIAAALTTKIDSFEKAFRKLSPESYETAKPVSDQ